MDGLPVLVGLFVSGSSWSVQVATGVSALALTVVSPATSITSWGDFSVVCCPRVVCFLSFDFRMEFFVIFWYLVG